MLHEDLGEWLRANHLYYKDLAKDVNASNLSYYTKGDGKPFPIQYIEVWRDKYNWTDAETYLFAFGKPFKNDPTLFKTEAEERALKALSGLKEALRAV